MKRLLQCALAIFILQTSGYAQGTLQKNDDVISSFGRLHSQQLLDTAKYFFLRNSADTALLCYNLIINTLVKSDDVEQQNRVIKALNNSAVLYTNMCDYRSAYKFLIDALLLSEKYNILSERAEIYNNLGNIYAQFRRYDIAKPYYFKALNLCQDSANIAAALSNLSFIEQKSGNIDSAFLYLNNAIQIKRSHNSKHLGSALNNMASLYQQTKQYDSAAYYFQLSLDKSRNNHQPELEAQTLYDLSNLFVEVNKPDSVVYYIELSGAIAAKNNFLGILAENYLALSKIEETKGNTRSALRHLKQYIELKDSIFNTNIFSDINQLQRLYEVSKTNQQIEQLVIEQQIKKRTIYYQKILWFTTLSVLLLVSSGLLFIYFQKRALNKAYKVLFEKNLEIIDFQKNSSETYRKKNKNKALTDSKQSELLDKILILMEDTSIICNTDFSIDKLAKLVNSNQNYVSQAINNTLKKNFRSLLNSYRIQEAQKLFSTPDNSKYTIEFVSLQVGFQSRAAFINAFKEVTGVTPIFYLKLMQQQV